MWAKVLVFLTLVTGAAYLYVNYGHYFRFSSVKMYKSAIEEYIEVEFFTASLYFTGLMVTLIGLNIPGATMMALSGGIFFAQPYALIYVFCGYTIGAVLSYTTVRFLFADIIRRKLLGSSDMFRKLETGIMKSDNYLQLVSFLIFIRYVAFFPFWFVNASCAILNVGLPFFVLTTALATLPGAVIYTLTGQLLSGILDKIDDGNTTRVILGLVYDLVWTDRTAQLVIALLLSCMLLPLVLKLSDKRKLAKKVKQK